MAGIYIHIPFCRKACHYCNFHFSTSTEGVEDMVMAIQKEILLRKETHSNPIQTIYFGGGTPSIIPLNLLNGLLETIRDTYILTDKPEITLEANPDDITDSKARSWKQAGINRFSIGIQSFFDSDLMWMNRAHNATQAMRSIEIIQNTGFSNFSIDLIYGTPGQSIEQWGQNLDIAFKNNIPHLSCYALTVEEGTALQKMIRNKKKEPVDQDLQSQFFKLLVNKTRHAGYQHYEISNFAKPNMESKHNSAYWDGTPYTGFGPSAHSFDGQNRTWNVSHNIDYIRSIQKNMLPSEKETLDEIDQLNEYIMISLRRNTGIEKSHIQHRWGADKLEQIEMEIQPFIQLGRVHNTNTHLKLSEEGKFFADGIASSLFFLK